MHNRAGLARGVYYRPTKCPWVTCYPGAILAQAQLNPRGQAYTPGANVLSGASLAPEDMAPVLGDFNNEGVVHIHHLARLLAIGGGVPLETVFVQPPLDLTHNDGDVVKTVAPGELEARPIIGLVGDCKHSGGKILAYLLLEREVVNNDLVVTELVRGDVAGASLRVHNQAQGLELVSFHRAVRGHGAVAILVSVDNIELVEFGAGGHDELLNVSG